MTFSINDLKHIILYGFSIAVLVFTLKWMKWKFLIIDHSVDIYIGLIAIFFTVLGIWIAFQLAKPKVTTPIVIEKEVPQKFTLNTAELEKLNLSNREYEVLQLLSKGHSNAAIADELFISVSTVKTHVSNIFEKMNIASRTQAIEKARRLSIIE